MKRSFSVLLALLGLALFAAAWQLSITLIEPSSVMAGYFSPRKAAEAMVRLAATGDIWQHTIDSMRRVFVSLSIAIVFGVPIGILLGVSKLFEHTNNLLFQFLRMVSPLSWMPIAVIAFGVGDAPVYFLLSFAGMWPIALNAAAGVRAIDPKWLRLARSMAASKSEILFRIVMPAILDHLLTGIRLSIGIIWIVLVPAEMLGVQAGLGYLILDCRDRMEYGELVAVIIYIGILGAILDYAARFIRNIWQRR
ncbi:ABC transporter permease [Campylobacterota bacterium]|nr:ABC transporter permease [Campylobacterota bacterium]